MLRWPGDSEGGVCCKPDMGVPFSLSIPVPVASLGRRLPERRLRICP